MATEQLTVPSKKAVRRAGETLRTPSVSNADFDAALQVLSDWRSLYYRPINTIQVLLRKTIKALCIKGSIVAQRLKRTPSIIAKLKRFPDMQLDRMQDIGGIRAVVNSVDEVRRVHESLIKGRHQHCLYFLLRTTFLILRTTDIAAFIRFSNTTRLNTKN